MIEEQTLCRVHRVGQTRNVTAIRYLIRDSFEEVSRYISSTNALNFRYIKLQLIANAIAASR